MSDGESHEVEVVKPTLPATTPANQLDLGSDRQLIDLSGLTEEQISVLKMKHADLAIETSMRGKKIGTDVQSLSATLSTIASQTETMTEKGMIATITNTRDDALGRTEIIIGNSEAAKSGKLSRSQKGLNDSPLLWMGFAIAVLLIFAILFGVMN